MRYLIIAAIVCTIIALICVVAPTVVLGAGWTIWFTGAFLAFLLDILLSSPVYNRRA